MKRNLSLSIRAPETTDTLGLDRMTSFDSQTVPTFLEKLETQVKQANRIVELLTMRCQRGKFL